MEVIEAFLNNFTVKKDTDGKPITHTGMPPFPGKWSIPEKKLSKFYKLISECYAKDALHIPIVEKMRENFPFVIDIDLKYKSEFTERQYNSDNIEKLLEYLWSKIDTCVEGAKDRNTVFLMEKAKPYPCNKGEYKTKDGIHLSFPDIIIEKSVYKKLISIIQSEDKIQSIFTEDCEVGPDNDTKGILDSSFSSWQLYGCGKQGETPYIVTKVYKFAEDGYPEELEQEIFDEYYTDMKTILNKMTMCYLKEDNVSYKDDFMKTLKVKKSTSSSSVSSNSIEIAETNIMSDMSQFASMFVQEAIKNTNKNPYFQFEEEDAKFIKELVGCLSAERASSYGLDDTGGWFDVALCLHNINQDPKFKNVSFLEDWKLFSSQCSSYDPIECETKWNSINPNHSGDRFGMGSLMYWAKNDNFEKFKEAKKNSLSALIDESVKIGAGADHLIAEIIYQYYKDEFISVNVKDEWFYFNGVRWEKTLEGTMLRMKIHKEISMLYAGYYSRYAKQAVDNPDDENFKKHLKNIQDIQIKLLKDSYVSTLMNSLRNLFYKKEIMESFDTNNNLVGFDNGVYDLKNNEFREGRPEDYITLSTKVSMPVDPKNLPIKLDRMINSFKMIPGYNQAYEEMNDFIDKIVPIPAVKNYTLRFLSKCLSGENRDEGFYIWTGTGGNGKSKLIDLMSMCMGDYSCNLPIALLTQKRKASGAASPEMAVTRGKRLAVMQEPDVNETLNVGQMKEITGNDKITARGLYKEPFEFTPQFKLICMCNDLPHIPSNDDGTWRRLEVVDFIARFVDYQNEVDEGKHRYLKDKGIKNKIPMWVIPFLAIILPHWREYDQFGIDIPKEVKAKTNEYRNNNDMVGQWIEQNCIEADNILATDGIMELAPSDFETLYDNFVEWCQEEEVNSRPDKKGVKAALKKWQEKSRFGLSYAKTKSEAEGMPNGYEKAMKFNLKIV